MSLLQSNHMKKLKITTPQMILCCFLCIIVIFFPYLKKIGVDCLNFFKVSEVLFETTEIVFFQRYFFQISEISLFKLCEPSVFVMSEAFF